MSDLEKTMEIELGNNALLKHAKLILERDERLSIGEQNILKEAVSKGLVPDVIALAFQLRHNEALIFKDKMELENAVARVFGLKVPADNILYSGNRFELYKRHTGRSVNENIVLYTTSLDEISQFPQYKQSTVRDYLDEVLSKAETMDVFELELALKEVNRRLDAERALGVNPSKKTLEQIALLDGHMKRARGELLKWAKRGYRTNNTRLDKILGREFHPRYKLPDKELMRTSEGKSFVKGLKRGEEVSPRERARFELSHAQLLVVYAQRRSNLLIDKELARDMLISSVSEKGKTVNLLEGRNPEEGFMRLSELKFNIQDGENRIVPGMSKSLIDASQKMTDILVSQDNPKSINPPGKNPLQDRREQLFAKHAKAEEKTILKWINQRTEASQRNGKGYTRKKN